MLLHFGAVDQIAQAELNGQPIFLHGVLDQGYFQDGIFLPEEPEEYERDILRMKELGFNTLRKHIKLETLARCPDGDQTAPTGR
ncbi:MAG: hypothetical protein HFF50_09400 [Lawsonibacter sp.]|nr:hypothetical protein [Lawsonibacter sp.]